MERENEAESDDDKDVNYEFQERVSCPAGCGESLRWDAKECPDPYCSARDLVTLIEDPDNMDEQILVVEVSRPPEADF